MTGNIKCGQLKFSLNVITYNEGQLLLQLIYKKDACGLWLVGHFTGTKHLKKEKKKKKRKKKKELK